MQSGKGSGFYVLALRSLSKFLSAKHLILVALTTSLVSVRLVPEDERTLTTVTDREDLKEGKIRKLFSNSLPISAYMAWSLNSQLIKQYFLS